ncbi:hypothetical protein BD289DRAFT_202576 [Coniella lustricola]|uniref:Uncharacterized protein n=1 Tax=Coniella lustricola TaxID=2025994 RepID=A0A2T2ZSG6_9PEZI|nr:hypothetical protein BD289DRAFT_202576 [Coniella lustricola]
MSATSVTLPVPRGPAPARIKRGLTATCLWLVSFLLHDSRCSLPTRTVSPLVSMGRPESLRLCFALSSMVLLCSVKHGIARAKTLRPDDGFCWFGVYTRVWDSQCSSAATTWICSSSPSSIS